MVQTGKTKYYFIFVILLFVFMWLLLLLRHENPLILIFLLAAAACSFGYANNISHMRIQKHCRTKRQNSKRKRWDAFLYDIDIVEKEIEEDSEESVKTVDKQAQISILQNQINPHFLYNTLESIRGQAIIEGADEIVKMVEALAIFFRYSISQKGNLVTLRDEINNVKNYFTIQQYRFNNRFSLNIKVDEDDEGVYDCLLPKLTLQPIVENAIFHGLETKGENGCVTISIIPTQKQLLITVSDDGVGINPEMLEEINRKIRNALTEDNENQTESSQGIALINVNKRIKLILGHQFGIHVYSTVNRGTDVEILIPQIKDNTHI